jgi:hypothetical protein
MQNQKTGDETLRKYFLNQEELFLVKYLKGFNRETEKKWQLENLAIFSVA